MTIGHPVQDKVIVMSEKEKNALIRLHQTALREDRIIEITENDIQTKPLDHTELRDSNLLHRSISEVILYFDNQHSSIEQKDVVTISSPFEISLLQRKEELVVNWYKLPDYLTIKNSCLTENEVVHFNNNLNGSIN